MSRSRRSTPILGIACSQSGEKQYKRYRAKKERAKVKEAFAHLRYDDLTFEQEPWDEWDCARDGKKYYTKKDLSGSWNTAPWQVWMK